MEAGSSIRYTADDSEDMLLRCCFSFRYPLSVVLAVDPKLPLGTFEDPLAQLQFFHCFHSLIDAQVAKAEEEFQRQGLPVSLWKFWWGSHRFVLTATASEPCHRAGDPIVPPTAAAALQPLLRGLFELGVTVQEAAARNLLPSGKPLLVTRALHHGELSTALVGFKRCLHLVGTTVDSVEAMLDNTPAGGFAVTAGVLEKLCPNRVAGRGLVRMVSQGPLCFPGGSLPDVWTLHLVLPRASGLHLANLLRHDSSSAAAVSSSGAGVGRKNDGARHTSGGGAGPSPSRVAGSWLPQQLGVQGAFSRPGHDAVAGSTQYCGWVVGGCVRPCLAALVLSLLVSMCLALLQRMSVAQLPGAAACMATRAVLWFIAWGLRQPAQQAHHCQSNALPAVCQLVGVAASLRIAHNIGLLTSRWSWQLSAADLFFLQALASNCFKCQALLHTATLAFLWLQPLRPSRHSATPWAQLLACVLYLIGVWFAGRRGVTVCGTSVRRIVSNARKPGEVSGNKAVGKPLSSVASMQPRRGCNGTTAHACSSSGATCSNSVRRSSGACSSSSSGGSGGCFARVPNGVSCSKGAAPAAVSSEAPLD